MALTRRYPSQSRRILYADTQHAAGYVFHGQRRQLHPVLRSLELASIPMACLVAFDKYRHHSAEAGAKFILNSMFSSALMLYGISMVYGTTGTTYFADITTALAGTPLQVMAMVFFFAGLGFKLSLVPSHVDTRYLSGAPTNVSAYLSVISKGAAAFALMSILIKVFGQMVADWSLLLSIVIVVTITIANIFAILQEDLKRFMLTVVSLSRLYHAGCTGRK